MQPENRISTNLSSKNIDPISYFEKDADFVLVYKKTEKLASAIYMVTNLFSENEPMKWTLRKKISDLVSLNVNYKDTSEASRTDLIQIIKTKILEIVSLLEVSLHGGLVSHMNFSVLKQEFSNLTEMLNSSNFSQNDLLKNSIPKSFFEVTSGTNTTVFDSSKYPQNKTILEQEYLVKRTSTDDLKDSQDSTVVKDDLKRSNRQNIILSLIKKKKELTIKDIAEVIKDCSEKTIQRELNAFILTGTLKRTGVRRWSKYSLNNSQ